VSPVFLKYKLLSKTLEKYVGQLLFNSGGHTGIGVGFGVGVIVGVGCGVNPTIDSTHGSPQIKKSY
jgi:hypothetical protein